jgi:hypothetical protein
MNALRTVSRIVDDAELGYVDVAGVGNVAYIRYPDGVEFRPRDWQGPQPDMADDYEIERTAWFDQRARLGIMPNGLPRALA